MLLFKTLTLTINGIQVDVQAAIVIDTKHKNQVSFKHIYFARVQPGGDAISNPGKKKRVGRRVLTRRETRINV